MNPEQLRTLFPVTKEAIYLNNASQAPLNTRIYDKLQTLIKTELLPTDKRSFNRDDTRLLLAKLLGGSAEEYALVTSTGVGMGIVAQGLKLNKGDNIVLPENEHWNNTFPWLQLKTKGVEVRFVKTNADNSIDPEAFEKLVDNNTKVVTVAAVRFNSGFRPNLKAIGKIAHEKGALFVVDVAQAAGMIPLDIEKNQIDVMAGCGFKWLLGMHGTGFLFVNKKAMEIISPTLPGMYAAKKQYNELSVLNDSRKYETGTIAYSLFDAWSESLELLIDIGVDSIYETTLNYTDLLIEGLQKKGYHIITPTKIREERTAILLFNTGSLENTKALFKKLKQKKVIVTLQFENIRVSPNFYNTKEDIDTFLSLV